MKKILLASTAIVGGALMASSPAVAGTVSSGDNYSVALGGIHRYMIGQYSYDASTGVGRGYGFAAPFTEINVKATAQADNGIKYGVTIEIETRGDADNVADEFYAIVEGDSWGRVELGANDGAADRMVISGANAMVATSGAMSGGLGIRQFLAQGGTMPASLSRFDNDLTASGDAVKAIYFTPRFAGFQLGASLTPSTSNSGRGATTEGSATNDDIENLYELGANYVGKFGDVGIIVAGTYQAGGEEWDGVTAAAPAGGTKRQDHKVWTIGGQVSFGGFTLGAGYQDMGDSGLAIGSTADTGTIYNVGVGYKMGPWGASLGYQYGERDLGTGAGDANVASISVGGQYAVAPGWTAMAEYVTYDVDNGPGTVSNDRSGFMLTNQFVF